MDIVKKLSIAFTIMILMICTFMNKTYAALNCNVNLSTPKNTLTYKEEFSVNVSISNLQTTNGIIAIGAIISYDRDSLTLIDIEGQNKWSDPFHNSSSGKITSFKNELSTKNEDVFKITFQVNEKEKAKDSAWIKISNFEISDGNEEKNCGGNSINIKIEDESNTNIENGDQENNNQKPNTEPENNNQKPGNSQTTKPSTGTKKPTGNSNTNVQNGNTNNEVTSNDENNVDIGNIENTVGEDATNNENETNNMQNIFENNVEVTKENKSMNKGLFYTIGVIAAFAIIGIVFVIAKYWRTK